MVLHRTDFAEMRVDWNDKAANLEDIARTMNLGIDAFVFVDDNPAERARMAARLPQVAVAPFPVTARRLARLFFPFAGGTDEDRARAGMYRADAERRRFAAGRSLDDYLKELEIWADVHPVRKSEYARVAQLSQRSNQFNVCTNRYTEADIASFAADPGRLIMVAHAGDRFGDQGLVAFVQAHEGEMVDWVMSCRAMNRGLEFAIEAVVEEELAKRGVSRISASWRRTPKNAPSADLFDRLGFSVEERGEDAVRYSLPLPRPPENKMPRHFVLGTHEGRICQ